MTNIPQEILHQILLRLPPKSIAKCKCINKEWQQHLESLEFTQQHQNRALRADPDSSNPSLILTCHSSLYIIHDPWIPSRPIKLTLPRCFKHNNGTIKVIGSSNGLVCVASGCGLNHYFLFNPYKPGSFRILPYARNRHCQERWWRYYFNKSRLFSGFGFDCINNDFKIVHGISNEPWMGIGADVLVFSLNSGSWKSFMTLPDLRPIRWASDHGVFLHNCLHWCGFWEQNKIISFDIHDEEWNEITFPCCQSVDFVNDMVVLRGCLGVLMAPGKSNAYPQLWIMKEYGVNESWTKLFELPIQCSFVMYSPLRCQVLLRNSLGLGWYGVDMGKVFDKESAKVVVENELKVSKAICFYGSLVSVLNSTKMLGRSKQSVATSKESFNDEQHETQS